MTRPRPTLGIVGAGRVGQALGQVLHSAGYPIGSVVCRSATAAREAVAFIGAGTPSTSTRLRTVNGDVVILATPDDTIESIAARLATLTPAFDGRTVLHVSGSLTSAVLSLLRARGAATGSFHPLQSFASAELGAARIAGSTFAIEGDRVAVRVATQLARDAGGRPVRIRANQKALYHAAAVMASGHVTALLDASLEAMEAAGFRPEDAMEAVMPLVEGTLANIRRSGTHSAITGPFARGDEATIARNRTALEAVDAALVRVYDELGKRSRRMRKS